MKCLFFIIIVFYSHDVFSQKAKYKVTTDTGFWLIEMQKKEDLGGFFYKDFLFIAKESLKKESKILETYLDGFLKYNNLNNSSIKDIIKNKVNDSSDLFYSYLQSEDDVRKGINRIKGNFYQDSLGTIYMALKVDIKCIRFTKLTKRFKGSVKSNEVCFIKRSYPYLYIYHYNSMAPININDMEKLKLKSIDMKELIFLECN